MRGGGMCWRMVPVRPMPVSFPTSTGNRTKEDLAKTNLFPVLGDQYGRALEDQRITIVYEGGGFYTSFNHNRLPVAPRTWHLILVRRGGAQASARRRAGGCARTGEHSHCHFPLAALHRNG